MTDVAQLRSRTDPFRAAVTGAIRRFAVKLTVKALWQLAGHTIDGVQELVRAEVFGGIGIAARPPAAGKPEAIVVMVADAENPVVIAVRDEKTRAAVAGSLAEDETACFNSLAILHFKSDGTIEARPVSGGPPVALALKSDVTAVKTTFDTHTHPGVTAGAAVTGAPAVPMPAPVGTTTFKAR
ncbi:MAG TPA: hypothetical protein VN253_02990 [Kofleriaceae bacterium]|nr:hypothetical protein [Kofleriaceae bacterium]